MHAPLYNHAHNLTRWHWVRHAPVVGDGKIISGQLDVGADLTDGPRLDALAARLPTGALWVTSHLNRARETAARLGGDDLLIEPDLAEQDFGAWAGQTWDEIGDEATPFWGAPAENIPPGGESFVDVCLRVQGVVERLTREHEGRHIIAVAHAGTIRAALALSHGLAPEKALAFDVQNLSLTRIEHAKNGGYWRVLKA